MTQWVSPEPDLHGGTATLSAAPRAQPQHPAPLWRTPRTPPAPQRPLHRGGHQPGGGDGGQGGGEGGEVSPNLECPRVTDVPIRGWVVPPYQCSPHPTGVPFLWVFPPHTCSPLLPPCPQVTFTVRVRAEKCLGPPQRVGLRVVGVPEELTLLLRVPCACPCAHRRGGAALCQGGDLECGVCRWGGGEIGEMGGGRLGGRGRVGRLWGGWEKWVGKGWGGGNGAGSEIWGGTGPMG